MRLFIAIEVPEHIQEVLLKAQEQIKSSARLTLAKEFHLTLKFLGEVSDSKVEEIKLRLENVSFAQLNLTLHGIGVFPDALRPRVIWTGVQPQERIIELQKRIDAALSGMFPAEKEYVPHLTLARVKKLENAQAFMAALKKRKIDSEQFSISFFSLIQSTLIPEGPVYTVLKKYEGA